MMDLDGLHVVCEQVESAPPNPSFSSRVQGALINLKTDKEGHLIQSEYLILMKMEANFGEMLRS